MSVLGVILFLTACAGHTALLVYSINWWYGQPLNHKLLRWIRHTHALLVLGFPLLLWWAFGLDMAGLWYPEFGPGWADVLRVYVVGCWAVSWGVLPAVTWGRLRHRPAALARNDTRTVDVAQALGYRPAGRGKHAHLARLPGNELFRVDFAERVLALRRLPAAWEGLTVLHLTDFHFHGTPDREFYRHVLDVCRDWEPDLVALTGDFVDTFRHHRWIVPLLGRLRWRVAAFAVLGNHDWWYEPSRVRRRLRRLGVRVLDNRWEQIEVRGQPMVVVGNEGPWSRPGPDLADCPAGVFRLCLSHTPDNIRWARRHEIDLMLSGHNHGGQIRFPVMGSLLVPSRYSRRYDSGTFDEPPTVLHVCRGLSGQHPVRYRCRPEVVKLVLQRGA
jgi:predicted MPP superfamily phosphohydrolase